MKPDLPLLKPGPTVLALATTLVLAACVAAPRLRPLASGPSPTPYVVAERLDSVMNQDMLWGGTIVDTRNFERYTELEIVSYPLDRQLRPQSDQRVEGRFIALRAGFLDPQNFAPGRAVTVRGPITGERALQLAGSKVLVAELDALELVLWPRGYRASGTRVSIGIGIGLGG